MLIADRLPCLGHSNGRVGYLTVALISISMVPYLLDIPDALTAHLQSSQVTKVLSQAYAHALIDSLLLYRRELRGNWFESRGIIKTWTRPAQSLCVLVTAQTLLPKVQMPALPAQGTRRMVNVT